MKLRHSHYVVILLTAIVLLFQFLCIDVIDPKPDLSVASMSFTPDDPTVEDSITFVVIVKNSGSESSPESNVLIRTGNDKKEFPVPMLSMGDTIHISYTVFFDSVRSCMSTVILDPHNTIEEENENNNTDSLSLLVNPLRRPSDLVIDTMFFSPKSPVINQVLTITAYIKNIGIYDAGACTVSVHLDQHGSRKYAIPILPQQSLYVIHHRVTPTVANTYTGIVMIDSSNDVKETNELNNTDTLIVTINGS